MKILKSDSVAGGSASNGHNMGSQNGHENHTVQLKTPRQEELVRLMVQSLQDMGLSESAKTLQKESGRSLETPTVTDFRHGVLYGDWETVERLLSSLEIRNRDIETVKFLIREQKYLELVEKQDMAKALHVLRHELGPLNLNTERVHELSSFIMCPNAESLRVRAQWDGAEGLSRASLLNTLQAYMPSATMIPPHRLDVLLDQAVQLQKMNCLYHNVDEDDTTLYVDHCCSRQRFPCNTTHIFDEHTDEVWFIAFSHNGNYLASASRDTRVAIWSLQEWSLMHTLCGHTKAVTYLAWSPDDTKLLTASSDTYLRLWNVTTGECPIEYSRHTDGVTACAWLPDGQRFVSASVDKNIYLWNIEGDILHKWAGIRVMDLTVSRDGAVMLAVYEKHLRMYTLEDKAETGLITESDCITSVAIAEDGHHVLVNLSNEEVHLWDLRQKRLVRKYVGNKQGRFVIRSCLGGLHDNFILSGSEDCKIYVWHRDKGVLIEELTGHTGCVNAVCWNPKRNMFASASDDHTIRIWG
ncbi:WD40-repeat-containing domain protein [Fimicolochytrium jonesii]|uniref:WD40-repeat-containing domain protein n=1 Tax=Fimicolochytrium jonesii TaxID=1396493 RepID=UPI0022FEC5A1|nr:WD40-repeat-containing domain protein [Fimicolochytrium jonesii]KAI8817138.1 WD40-repeat-containing domain protein [Fimicolochytrium jonesii]